MFRHTRATTVVSQPPRLSTSSASTRLSRSQASWTASSASLDRAEHPVGHRPELGPVRLEPFGQQIVFDHLSHPPSHVRHSIDRTKPVDVTSHEEEPMTEGVKTVIYPVKDLDGAKALFTALLGAAPESGHALLRRLEASPGRTSASTPTATPKG